MESMRIAHSRLIVAPFAGAWIEIACITYCISILFVAPFAGAWIEIGEATVYIPGGIVAPFAGAWIEIVQNQEIFDANESRSLRGSVD